MKKISLKNINLSDVEQLSRGQLKNVIGGLLGFTTSPGDPTTNCDPETHFECWCDSPAGSFFAGCVTSETMCSNICGGN